MLRPFPERSQSGAYSNSAHARKPDGEVATLEQRHAKPRLQEPYLLTDRARRDAEPARGSLHAKNPPNFDQGAQLQQRQWCGYGFSLA